eukprot:gene9335-12578_t
MLTRKQLWRKQKHDFIRKNPTSTIQETQASITENGNQSHNLFNEFKVLEMVDDQNIESFIRSTSDDNTSTESLDSFRRTAAENKALNENKLNNTSSGGQIKSVSFHSIIHVCLIPTRTEIIQHGLFHDLFWENDDFKYFKADALNEIRIFCQFAKSKITTDEAITLLYQPECPLADSKENYISSEREERFQIEYKYF